MSRLISKYRCFAVTTLRCYMAYIIYRRKRLGFFAGSILRLLIQDERSHSYQKASKSSESSLARGLTSDTAPSELHLAATGHFRNRCSMLACSQAELVSRFSCFTDSSPRRLLHFCDALQIAKHLTRQHVADEVVKDLTVGADRPEMSAVTTGIRGLLSQRLATREISSPDIIQSTIVLLGKNTYCFMEYQREGNDVQLFWRQAAE